MDSKRKRMRGFKVFSITALLLTAVAVVPTGAIPPQAPRLTVLYDNTVAAPGLQADWGFAGLIEGMSKTILFDTGTKPDILLSNIKALGVDISRIEVIVISHLHGDHMGGLERILDANPRVTLYVPAAISELSETARVPTLKSLSRLGTTVVPVIEPVEICPGVRVTGQITGPNRIAEIALLLEKGAEGILITGCAHPGIVDIVRKAGALRGKPVETVLGGFHLMQTPAEEVGRIIADMKAAGVQRCGATHCTGETAIAQFQAAFGPEFIPLGVGRKVEL